MLTIRLPASLEQRITYLAEQTGRTKTFYIREALVDYLDDVGDRYLAVSRLEKPAKRWTLDEVEQGRDLGA